ncbi:MAG: glycosyltransferase [Enterovibrio sp.]
MNYFISLITLPYSLFLIISRYECFGQTLIEDRSQGLPMIGYDIYPSFYWIVKGGFNSKAIEPYQTKYFVEAIQEILADKEIFCNYSKPSLIAAQETESIHIDKLWIRLIQEQRI